MALAVMDSKMASNSDSQILTSTNVVKNEEKAPGSDITPVQGQVEIPDGGFQAWSTLAGA